MAQKVEAQGGKGGNQWDDGSEHDAVTKIQVAPGGNGIQYVKFDYVKNGKTEEAPLRGVKGRSITADPFVINHPEEHLVSVEGWFNPEGLIQGLRFRSNKKTSDVIGYEDGTPFALQVQGKKIIGFHGFAGDYVHTLGAYFAPLTTSAIKHEAGGGTGGTSWDDGVHDGVRKVHVGQGQDGVSCINVVYDKNSQEVEGGEHGKKTLLGFETFEVDADDYIVVVQVTYDKVFGQDSDIITSITFYTFKGKTSPPYGLETENKFVLKDKNGGKLVGFHGFAGDNLHSLGAYFAPLTNITPLTHAKKLEAKGGEMGNVWDDGAYGGVRKVYLGKGQDGIAFVKFEYLNGSQVVIGEEHGKKTMLGVDEFEVDADDYIVYVEGYREKVNDEPSEIITFLTFKTYKGKTSQPIEQKPGTKFLLQGGKIVGFHGRSTDVLHSIGAYISLPSTPKLLGKWMKVEQKGEGPGLRCSHGIAQVGNKIYSFGGEFTPNQPIDKHLFVFDLETQTWSISPATGDVPNLSCLGVRMVSVGSTLYVFGGRDASRKYNGFYSFDTTKNEWKLLTPVEEGPVPRSFHSMAADENNVYIFGGVIATDRVKTLDAYNIVDKKWVQCSPLGDSITTRGGAGLEVVQGKVWVVYGFNGCELDDIHSYDPVQDKWTQVETFGERPSERSVFASAAFGKHIVMFGGEIAMDPLAHVGPGQLADGTFALDTETLRWERLDKFGEEVETPSSRGWSASTTGTIGGKMGLVMQGGKAPTNDRFDDLFFYGIDSAKTL